MIRLTKRPLPPNVTIESENDYRQGVVFHILVEDCHRKCYICEDKPTTINVEHRVPHRGDRAIKLDWNNLFLACGHCNNIKRATFDDIIDPTKCDPEEHIALSVEISNSLIEQVKIEPLTTDNSTMQTVELLGLVYNGGSTDIKEIECSNLRNKHLMPDLRLFYQYVRNYPEDPDYATLINKEIDRSSAFAAFKRKIVRDDPKLSKDFAEVLK